MYGSSDFLDSKTTYASLLLCKPVPVGFVKNAGAIGKLGMSAHISGKELYFLSLLAAVIIFIQFNYIYIHAHSNSGRFNAPLSMNCMGITEATLCDCLREHTSWAKVQ